MDDREQREQPLEDLDVEARDSEDVKGGVGDVNNLNAQPADGAPAQDASRYNIRQAWPKKYA
jgi:hypothetical protein